MNAKREKSFYPDSVTADYKSIGGTSIECQSSKMVTCNGTFCGRNILHLC